LQSPLQKIVVTGASGTLGSRILDQFAGCPNTQVLALLRKESRIRQEYENVRFERVDFFDRATLAETIRAFRPDTLIHCAASGVQFPRPQWFDMLRFNIDVSIHLCECIAAIPQCHLIFISTGLAYRETGGPLRESDALDTCHPYGASKAAGDMLVRAAASEFGVPLTVFRPFSFTGLADDGNRLFPSLLRAAMSGTPLELSPGDQVRDHCAVDDVAHAIARAALDERREPLRIFNLGSGSTVTLRALVEEVVETLQIPVQLQFGARPYARFEPMHLVADASHARECLGWSPRISLPHAVWQLANASFPLLNLRQPPQSA